MQRRPEYNIVSFNKTYLKYNDSMITVNINGSITVNSDDIANGILICNYRDSLIDLILRSSRDNNDKIVFKNSYHIYESQMNKSELSLIVDDDLISNIVVSRRKASNNEYTFIGIYKRKSNETIR